MGRDNVDRAFAVVAGVASARAGLVFVAMARWAHDEREPPRYWRGAEFLADMLGCSIPTVDRAWADLVECGLIKDGGYLGRRRVWVLDLPLSTGGENVVHSPGR